jgi:hypothetical protein
MERIADLDELLLRCRPGPARVYAEEAVATYRAGAYRACIVTTWIAVVFDLIDKMREIALFGNAEAKLQLEKFDKWQDQIAQGNQAVLKSALEFERTILNYMLDKFELFDGQQLIELRRLQEDRNRCAHPTFQREGTPYQPSGEMARAHLCNAIICLFQQPPVQGRSALAELRKQIESQYFPRDAARAKQVLIDGPLARPSDALIRGAVDQILFGYFELGDSYYQNRAILGALAAILEIRRSVAEPRLIEKTRRIFPRLSDEALPFMAFLITVVPECQHALSEAHFHKLCDYIREGPLAFVTYLAAGAYQVAELRDAVKDRVTALEAESLALLIKEGLPIKEGLEEVVVDRAVDLYCTVKSWDAANFVAENLVIPLLTHLERRHIERIIKAPSEEGADLRGSRGFGRLLEKIRREEIIDIVVLDELMRENALEYLIPIEARQSSAPTGFVLPRVP